MTTIPDRIAALTALSMQDAADLRKIVTQGHTAAFIAGTAERLGVTPDSALISRQRLSRAERQDIEKAVKGQLQYLENFLKERSTLSPAALRARLALWGGATKTTYYAARWGAWDVPGELMPGMQACKGACLCSVSVKDNGDGTGVLTRTMGGTEHHCKECPPLAGDHPVKRRGAYAIKHGAHDQSTHGRRRGGGGGGGALGGSELADRIRTIDAELASPYLSSGRRQLLEEQRRKLQESGGTTPASSQASAPISSQQTQSIDAELASPYLSPGRRQMLEEQRQKLQSAVPAATRDGGQQRLKQELDAEERTSRTLDVERATFFDANGNRLVQTTGDAKSYQLSQAEFNSLRNANATMTHNHPGGRQYSPGDPRHTGSSFSIADVRQAAALDLAEVRAVTPTRRFWMRPPPGGWQDHHWKTTIPQSHARHDKAVLAELVKQVRTGKITVAEANARHHHEVWLRVSKELGIPYGFEDR